MKFPQVHSSSSGKGGNLDYLEEEQIKKLSFKIKILKNQTFRIFENFKK